MSYIQIQAAKDGSSRSVPQNLGNVRAWTCKKVLIALDLDGERVFSQHNTRLLLVGL